MILSQSGRWDRFCCGKAGYGACPIQRQASLQAYSSLPVSPRGSGAQGAEGNEAAADNFLSLPDSLFYLSMGHMMGLPIPGFSRGGKRSRIRLYPASAVSAHRVSEPSLFLPEALPPCGTAPLTWIP